MLARVETRYVDATVAIPRIEGEIAAMSERLVALARDGYVAPLIAGRQITQAESRGAARAVRHLVNELRLDTPAALELVGAAVGVSPRTVKNWVSRR
jgi:hypothetical protein